MVKSYYNIHLLVLYKKYYGGWKMKKTLSKLLSGTLALMFAGQIMIYGDGSSQGIVHADQERHSIVKECR